MSSFSIFLILITVICFLLGLVIMVQNPKGGGLSSSLGGSTQIGGVQKTTDFLDKSTWTLGAILILLILFSSLSFGDLLGSSESKIIDKSAVQTPKAVTPSPKTPVPAAQTPKK